MDILNKIKQAGLVGRGGACFPVWQKWSAVAKAMADKSAVASACASSDAKALADKKASADKKALADKTIEERKSYVICNGAEGEPGVEKDGYIIEHFPERVIDGIKIAINFLSAEKAYIYLNNKYFQKFGKKFKNLIGNSPIEFFIKPFDSGYIGGEESAILNIIEGHRLSGASIRAEPRLRPPFPTSHGLWNAPTLINNVETFYNVSLVAAGQFKKTRFYTISGDCPRPGVYELIDNYTISRVLKETANLPGFNFFVQVGGSMSGEVLNAGQLKRSVAGAGSITIYSLEKNGAKKIVMDWLDFFVSESCGQCTPCREGIYRLKELACAPKIDWQLFKELVDNLTELSFCSLGCAAAVPLKSFIINVLPKITEKKLEPAWRDQKVIVQTFKNS